MKIRSKIFCLRCLCVFCAFAAIGSLDANGFITYHPMPIAALSAVFLTMAAACYRAADKKESVMLQQQHDARVKERPIKVQSFPFDCTAKEEEFQ